jgi:hypothetical protein
MIPAKIHMHPVQYTHMICLLPVLDFYLVYPSGVVDDDFFKRIVFLVD